MSSDAALFRYFRPKSRLWLGLMGLMAIGVSGCSSFGSFDADKPEVSLAGLSFAEAGLFEQGFTVQLRMKNPNDFDIPVEALDFALSVNGASFAKGLTNEDFTLPASSEIVIPIDVTITTEDLIERVTAIGTGRRLDYALTGTAELATWFTDPVAFSRAGKLALPDIPGLFQEDPPES